LHLLETYLVKPAGTGVLTPHRVKQITAILRGGIIYKLYILYNYIYNYIII